MAETWSDQFLTMSNQKLLYHFTDILILEAVVLRSSTKKVFLEVSWNSQENTCATASFLTRLQASGLQLY